MRSKWQCMVSISRALLLSFSMICKSRQFTLIVSRRATNAGKLCVTAAITRAWDMSAKRVWVHTCSLDHPRALPNYQARGFRIFLVEEKFEELPDTPLEPWPGANLSHDTI